MPSKIQLSLREIQCRNVVEIFEGMQAAGVLAPVDVGFIAQFKAKVAELEGR